MGIIESWLVVGRRPNPQRKVDLLGEIADYILENGLSDLSLRPLAKELGTSTYTLTYQFGSKEAMVIDAVTHIDHVQAERYVSRDSDDDSPADIVRNMWDLSTTDEGLAWSQVMLEVATVTSRQPILFDEFESKALSGRIARLASAFGNGSPTAVDTARATMSAAALNGLVYDMLLTGDSTRTGHALECLARTLESEAVAQSGVFDELTRI